MDLVPATRTLVEVKVKEEPEDNISDYNLSVRTKAGAKRKLLKCKDCDYSTVHRSQYVAHMVKHTGQYPYKCEECGRKFTANSSLKRHIEEVHQGLKPFQCVFCSKAFYNAAGLKSHSTTHTKEKPNQCKTCGKSFSLIGNLRRHERIHTGAKPYNCQLCGASFTDYSSIKYHMLRHSGEKPYLCHVCDKQFFTASDLKRHSTRHVDQRPFDCSICGMTFKVKGTLLKHIEVHDESRRMWKCSYCDKQLCSKGSLRTHVKTTHEGVKAYQCTICQKRFTSKMYLEHHRVVHTQEKPYACTVCSKSFSHQSNLRRHQRIHSSKMRYTCRYCNKGFKYINSWQYHEKSVHQKVAPFSCDTCGYKFKSRNGWTGHRCRAIQLEEINGGHIKDLGDAGMTGKQTTQANTRSSGEGGDVTGRLTMPVETRSQSASGSKGGNHIVNSRKIERQGLLTKFSELPSNSRKRTRTAEKREGGSTVGKKCVLQQTIPRKGSSKKTMMVPGHSRISSNSTTISKENADDEKETPVSDSAKACTVVCSDLNDRSQIATGELISNQEQQNSVIKCQDSCGSLPGTGETIPIELNHTDVSVSEACVLQHSQSTMRCAKRRKYSYPCTRMRRRKRRRCVADTPLDGDGQPVFQVVVKSEPLLENCADIQSYSDHIQPHRDDSCSGGDEQKVTFGSGFLLAGEESQVFFGDVSSLGENNGTCAVEPFEEELPVCTIEDVCSLKCL